MALSLFEEAKVALPEAGSGGGECGCSSDCRYHPKKAFLAFFSSRLDSSYKNELKIIRKAPPNYPKALFVI